jgi:maleate cis-trans isomerase
MPTVGMLYPGHAAEGDFPALVERLSATRPDGWDLALPLVHTSVGEDAHRVDALLDLGGHERLLEGARSLTREHRLDALMWACTSGSFVFGWDGAHRQVDDLSRATGVPTSSTSLAFVSACRALGVTRVSVAASYPQDVAEHFVSFLARGGVEITAMSSHDIYTAAEVGTLGRPEVLRLVTGVAHDQAQAVLVPDTAMHSLGWIDDLEDAVGKPVLTANQVTVFEGLRLAGEVPALPGLGALFASDAALGS